MALDPNIALNVRGIELQNPLAQYGQIASIQNAQNQNALAQYQLGAAQRQDVAQNALSDAYKAAYNPKTGDIDSNLLVRGLAERGAGHLIPDVQAKLLTTEKERGLIKKTAVETTGLEFEQRVKKANQAILDIAALNSPEQAIASIDQNLQKGNIDTEKANMLKSRLAIAPSFDKWKDDMLVGIIDAKGRLEQRKITTKDTDRGGYIERQTYDAQGMPVGLPIKLPKTATIGEQTAQGQLGLAKQKFAWEQANPGQTIHEDANGLLAVNNRTGVATPVVYGPMGIQPAPAAAPSVMRQQPNAGMPGARIPAVPGMTSVLDQTAAPTVMPLPAEGGVRVAGAPVGGKERNLPEHFVKTDMQLSGLAGSLKEFKDEIKANPTTGAKWLPTGADTARMQAKYTSLLMGLKDLYTLGALAGPDMSIIESQITNPASWTGKFTTKKGFENQVQVIEDMLKRSSSNLENSYGKVPKATKKAIEALSSNADTGIPNATPNNPLGLSLPGGR